MEKKVYKSYEELPLMLTVVPDMASVLGVSRAGAYELAHSEGFPVLKSWKPDRNSKGQVPPLD